MQTAKARSLRSAPAAFILGLVATLLSGVAGCAPLSVTFTLGATQAGLEETSVLGWPDDNRRPTAKVAVIDVQGLIADTPRPGLLGSTPAATDSLAARLRRAAEDQDVEAVILRLNSPGGTVAGSEVMTRELDAFRESTGKPIVVSMGEIAASGAYYISLAADHVVAQPTTITGSIGVIIPTLNVSDGLSRIGIVSRSVTSGPNKDIANPLEPMEDGQYAILEGMVGEFYASFRALVVERRSPKGLDRAHLDDLTDGRIMTGEQALRGGLVDELGGVREAAAAAARLAGVDAVTLVKYHAPGAAPRSVYADASDVPLPTANGAHQPTVVQAEAKLVDAGSLARLPSAEGASVTPGVAYYLWLPATP